MTKQVDVAVVGCGVSGSVVGAYLAKAGRKPVVFEATDRIGGPKYGGYDVNGFHADLTHIPVTALCWNGGGGWWPKAAREVGAPIQFQCLPNNAFYVGGKVARVPYSTSGRAFANFMKNMVPFDVPEETLLGLQKVFDFAVSLPEETLWSEEYDVTPAKQIVDKITDDDLAKMLFGGLAGMMLCIPPDMALEKVCARMVFASFLAGLFGGQANMVGLIGGACDVIPKGFCKVMTDNGGQVLLSHPVKQVRIEAGRATGVIVSLPDGSEETYQANEVIISTEYGAYKKLLGKHLPKQIETTIEAFEANAFIDLDVHFGLKRPVIKPGYSFIAFIDDENTFQGLAASLPHFEPTQIPEGKELLQLQLFKPADLYKTKTPEEWTEILLSAVEKLWPGVRDEIEFKHVTEIYQPFQYSNVPVKKVPYSVPEISHLHFTGDCTVAPASVTDKAAASAMAVAKLLLS